MASGFISDKTQGKIRIYPVTLYRSLDELAARGLIEELPEADVAQHNERRRYYGITPEGRRALAAEAEALEAVARMAHEALEMGRAS